ncbi:MAG: coiled-coil domain-containing protein [Oscillospiraceae bacterium]
MPPIPGMWCPGRKTSTEEIKIIHDEIENLNAQIQNYNQLIVEKQKELDDAQTRQAELNQQYRVRIRTMEESGKISYWSVLFQANSFTDLLDTINKISEIAAHDQAMLAELDRVAQETQTAQAELAQGEVQPGRPKDCSGSEPGGVGREERRGKRHSGRADR